MFLYDMKHSGESCGRPADEVEDIPRTTNAAESFHAHIKAQFKSRPNLYLLALKLLELQEETYVNLQSIHRVNSLPSTIKEKLDHLSNVCHRYKYFYLSRKKYVRMMAYKHLALD